MNETEDVNVKKCRRKMLSNVCAAILLEGGVGSCPNIVIETLTELLACFLHEVGNSTRNHCEIAGRTEPVVADVILALINMGISIDGLEAYAARPNRYVLGAPAELTAPRTTAMLSAGTKLKGHIPAHLPTFPDPHAYVRTPTHKQPVTEYEAIREKSANQKRDIEKALIKFLAKTGDTHSLFNTDDNQMFPLIACKPTFPAYLPCLLPMDQVFDFEELEYHFQVANRTEDMPSTEKKEHSDGEGDGGDNDGIDNSQDQTSIGL